MIIPSLSGFARTAVAASLVASLAMPGVASATTVIALWTFEAPNVPGATTGQSSGPWNPATGSGSASGFHTSTATAWSTPAGNGSAESFSSNNWAIGDYFQFEVSTLGLSTVTLAWDQTSSATGPGVFDLQYRVGNTGAFTTFLNDYVVLPNQADAPGAGPWNVTTPISAYSYSSDLSAVTAINNQSIVQFRLTMATAADSTPPGTVASTGSSRVDNFTVNAVPEPSTVGLAVAGGLGLAGIAARRRLRKA